MTEFDHRIDDDDDREVLDTSTSEPPVFGEARHTVLSPSGDHESNRDFLRALGPRRVKIAVFSVGVVAMVMAVLAAMQ